MPALAAQHLLPRERHHIELVPRQVHREGRRGRITNRQTFALRRDRVAIRHTHAARRAVPREDHVLVEIDRREVHDLTIGRLPHHGVQLQLLDDVRHPAFAEGFPGQHLHRTRTEKRPKRHLDGAGVRGGHDADAVVGGHAQDFTGKVDRLFQLRLAHRGAMRTAQRRIRKHVEGKAGDLRARARREARISRARDRCVRNHCWYPSRYTPLVGEGCPAAADRGSRALAQAGKLL